MSDKIENKVARLYDGLSVVDLLIRKIKPGVGSGDLTMHKALRVPDLSEYKHLSGTEFINELVFRELELAEKSVLVDLGCGFGGSLFYWRKKQMARYFGRTLSERQFQRGQKYIGENRLRETVLLELADFERPFSENADVVTAIEALIHSPDLAVTISNISAGLQPGGQVILVDDLFRETLPDENLPEYAELKKRWFLHKIHSKDSVIRLLEKNGFRVTKMSDLTEYVQLQTNEQIRENIKRLQFLEKWLPLKHLRTYFSAQIGGLYLQSLYAKGLLGYDLISARKK